MRSMVFWCQPIHFFQFLGAPWLGRLSDSVGRKPVLLISQAGTLLSWFVFGLAWFIPDISLGFVALPHRHLFSRILDGITGGNNSVTQAYVSDLADHKEKGGLFGTLGGIAGIGLIVGPGLGGYFASGPIGYLGVAICGAVISLVTLLSIHFNLQESLPQGLRKPRVRQPPLQSFRFLNRIRTLNPSLMIKRIFMARAIFSVMMACYVSTIPLFIIDLFDFDEGTLGLFMLVVGAFLSFNQAVLSKWFIRRIGESATLKLGLC